MVYSRARQSEVCHLPLRVYKTHRPHHRACNNCFLLYHGNRFLFFGGDLLSSSIIITMKLAQLKKQTNSAVDGSNCKQQWSSLTDTMICHFPWYISPTVGTIQVMYPVGYIIHVPPSHVHASL